MKRKIIFLIMAAIFVISGIFFLRQKVTPQNKTNPPYPQIPIFPQAKFISSSETPVRGGIKYETSLSAVIPVSQITVWYMDNLGKSGWTIDIAPADLKAEEIQYLVAKNRDFLLQLSVIRNSDENVTEIINEILPQSMMDEGEEE